MLRKGDNEMKKIIISGIVCMLLIISFVLITQASPPRPGDNEPVRPGGEPPHPDINSTSMPSVSRPTTEPFYGIIGTVTNAETGELGVGFYVRINDTVVRTDSKGTYSLTGAEVQAGVYTITLDLPVELQLAHPPKIVSVGEWQTVVVDLQYTTDWLRLRLQSARDRVQHLSTKVEQLKQELAASERQLSQVKHELTRLEEQAGLTTEHVISSTHETTMFWDTPALALPPPSPPTSLFTAEMAHGGYFGIHVTNATQGMWVAVQWQDGLGNWYNVDGWQGELHNNHQQLWWVDKSNFGKGPFRWIVYDKQGGTEIVTSSLFYLPQNMGEVVMIEVLRGR